MRKSKRVVYSSENLQDPRNLSDIPIHKAIKKYHHKEPSLTESFRESFENPTFILSSVVVGVCALRFLFDGAALNLFGVILVFPHTDPLAYGSILAPVLAGHAYIRAKAKITGVSNDKEKVDNPDA